MFKKNNDNLIRKTRKVNRKLKELVTKYRSMISTITETHHQAFQ